MPDDVMQEQLAQYVEAVRASPHNLLSARGLEELASRHVPECVTFARGLQPGPRRVLDVGTGGGLPGLVIAIVRPDLEVSLLDATRKKIAFVEMTAATLGVDVTCLHGRAEELATTSLGGSFDAVTARAVAPLHRLLPWTASFLRPGGLLHAIKGVRWAQELQEALPVIRQQRLQVVGTPPADPSSSPGPLVVTLRRCGVAQR